MSTVEESSFDDAGRAFFNFSCKMEEPLYWAYGALRYRLVSPLDPDKFDNAASKIKEIATRVLIAFCAVFGLCFAGTHLLLTAVFLEASSQILRYIGFTLQKNGFTHIRGSAPEKVLKDGQATLMTWNIRGHRGVNYAQGGVIPWPSRIDGIIKKIEAEDPDVLVLQEIKDAALVEALIEKLGDRYAHFFTHLSEESMVITKCNVSRFSHRELTHNGQILNRGFETFEIKGKDLHPCVRIIATQLLPGKENGEKRLEQVAQIINALAKEKSDLATFFMGNIDMDSQEEKDFLSKYLSHSYRGGGPTRTSGLVAQWDSKLDAGEKIEDFISCFKRNLSDGTSLPVVEKGVELMDCHLVQAVEIIDKIPNTKTALSDHYGVVAKVNGLRSQESAK